MKKSFLPPLLRRNTPKKFSAEKINVFYRLMFEQIFSKDIQNFDSNLIESKINNYLEQTDGDVIKASGIFLADFNKHMTLYDRAGVFQSNPDQNTRAYADNGRMTLEDNSNSSMQIIDAMRGLLFKITSKHSRTPPGFSDQFIMQMVDDSGGDMNKAVERLYLYTEPHLH